MKLGIDYIGGVNYIDVLTKHHPEGYAAGFLMRASGWKNGIIAARALAETGKCPIMRIHGLWRDTHAFNEDDVRYAATQAEKVAVLAKDFPKIQMYYSPWLEHRAPAWLWERCKKKCREVLPTRVRIVNCGNRMPGINEVHHGLPINGRYIYSYDGYDMFESSPNGVHNTKVAHYESIIFYGWTWHCNGREDENDKTPRKNRTHWLTKADINKMVLWLEK